MVEYRTESCYGSGVRDLAEILTYEIEELGNDGTLDELVERGLIPGTELTLGTDKEIGNAVVREINKSTGRNFKYGLWLASKDAVQSLYDGSDDIDAYEASDTVLVDLGYDGRLYAYESMPEPVLE